MNYVRSISRNIDPMQLGVIHVTNRNCAEQHRVYNNWTRQENETKGSWNSRKSEKAFRSGITLLQYFERKSEIAGFNCHKLVTFILSNLFPISLQHQAFKFVRTGTWCWWREREWVQSPISIFKYITLHSNTAIYTYLMLLLLLLFLLLVSFLLV